MGRKRVPLVEALLTARHRTRVGMLVGVCPVVALPVLLSVGERALRYGSGLRRVRKHDLNMFGVSRAEPPREAAYLVK